AARRPGEALARQRARLRPEEVRFLRKYLSLSGPDFARIMDAAPETVSRWETGRQQMSLMAEGSRGCLSARVSLSPTARWSRWPPRGPRCRRRRPSPRLELQHGARQPRAA